MFKDSKSKPKAGPKRKKKLADLNKMHTEQELWDLPKNQKLIANIANNLSLDKESYESYYLPVLKRFLERVESLPDSTNRFYSYQFGMFEYALQRAEAAISLLANYLLVDEGKELSNVQRCWQYAMFTAAILLGVGKLYLDYDIDLYTDSGEFIKTWNPIFDKLIQPVPYYSLNIEHDPSVVETRTRINLILAKIIMPS